MATESSRILKSISFDLMDVEVSDFSLVWWDNVCAINKLASQELAMSVEERDEYQKIKTRFQAQKAKDPIVGSRVSRN